MIFVGDTHGDFKPFHRILEHTRDSTIVGVGDHAFGFPALSSEFELLNSRLRHSNSYLYLCRGNHDNPSAFKDYQPYSHIRGVPDGTVLTLEGKRTLFLGGAISIDRIQRTAGVNYFPEEDYSTPPTIDTIANVDILVTHTAPECLHPVITPFTTILHNQDQGDTHLTSDLLRTSERLERDVRRIFAKSPNLSNWYYGHFHQDFTSSYTFNTRHIATRCLAINSIYTHY